MAKNARKSSVRVNIQISGRSASVNVATTGNATVNVKVDARRKPKPTGCILWRGASRIVGHGNPVIMRNVNRNLSTSN
jgi:hypothetical protein